jgi:hypothetical protein
VKQTATLTVHDVEYRRSQRYTIDCQHGTTTAVFKPGESISEEELIRALVERHSTRERCRCAAGLAKAAKEGRRDYRS